MSASPSALYVYCLLRASDPPDTTGAPPGLPGASAVRLLELAPQRWLAVADVPAAAYDEQALADGLADLEWVAERAVAHEAVIAHFLDAGDVLPLKLFTVFLDAARAQAAFGRDLDGIGRQLDRISGCHEWGLRVRLEEDRAVRVVEARLAAEQDAGAGQGTAFLLRKKRSRDAKQLARAEGLSAAREVYEALTELAREAKQKPAAEPVLLDGVFLVAAAGTDAFHAAVERERARLDERGVSSQLSGPWPAYHFLEVSR